MPAPTDEKGNIDNIKLIKKHILDREWAKCAKWNFLKTVGKSFIEIISRFWSVKIILSLDGYSTVVL